MEYLNYLRTRQEVRMAVIRRLKDVIKECRLLKGKIDTYSYANEFYDLMIKIPCYFNTEENVKKLSERIGRIKRGDRLVEFLEEVENILPILEHKANELRWAEETYLEYLKNKSGNLNS